MKLRNSVVWALAGAAGATAASANSFDCLIEPAQMVEVRSPVEGLIEKVLVQRGDRVVAGQPLVQLDSAVENSALETARYRSQTEGRIATARSRLDFAHKKLERQTQLEGAQFVAAQARDEAEAEKRVAEAELTDAQEVRQLALHEVRQISEQINRRTLRSPFNGVVVDRLLNPGDLAEAGTGRRPILKLAQVEPLRVEVVLPLAAFGRLKRGGAATVTPEVLGGRYAAQVSVIDTVFDSASGTFGVRLQMANPDRKVPAGIRCKVEFEQLQGLALKADRKAGPAP